ncbi:hypothetical protein RRF57_012908 [Xylaria bambusicola]|uniref:Uncharacterized protein n=1 Tax=Xylaria bambusicola TaxID=326684 RepID=A0AAN7V143_9PEZI
MFEKSTLRLVNLETERVREQRHSGRLNASASHPLSLVHTYHSLVYTNIREEIAPNKGLDSADMIRGDAYRPSRSSLEGPSIGTSGSHITRMSYIDCSSILLAMAFGEEKGVCTSAFALRLWIWRNRSVVGPIVGDPRNPQWADL